MSSALRCLYKASTLVEILDIFRQEIPEKICIIVANDSVETHFNYATLWQRSLLAAEKMAQYTEPGDRVILALPTSPEFIEFFFGCLLSGRVAVPLPVEKSTSRFSRAQKVIGDCTPRLAVFRSGADFEKMKSGMESIHSLIVDEKVLNHSKPSTKSSLQIRPSQVALIQYTSGSTADPKGVVLTHSNILANLKMIQQGMEITSEERVVSWLPLHHDMGLIGNLLSFVCSGGSTYLYPYQEFARNPSSWLEAMSKQKATLSGAPTFAFDLLGKRGEKSTSPEIDLSSLRLLYCGSERILAKVIERFYRALAPRGLNPCTFFSCYGMAEASLYVSGGFQDPLKLPHVEWNEFSYPLCGHVANGLALQVCDEENKPLPPGEVGEIQISGASVSLGYWSQIASSVDAGDLLLASGAWLKTGDLGVVNAHQVAITGRLKDVIKVRGQNIHAEDIEVVIEVLEDWLAANSVVAVGTAPGVSNDPRESLTIIAEVLRGRRRGPFQELLEEIQARLSEINLRCERLVLVSPASLPKTSSGKKQRAKTAKMLESGQLKIIWDSNFETVNERPSVPDRVSVKIASIEKLMDSVNLDLADERRTFPASFINDLRRSDLLGLLIASEDGGAGLTHTDFAKVGEALGRIDLSLGGIVGNHNTIGVLPILRSKTYLDRKKVLQDIAKNGAIASFAITEPLAGSNPRAMQSRVQHIGGQLVLTGEKIWIGNALFADYISVFAREFSAQGDELGISAFLLRTGHHKFVVGPEQLTVGLRAMPQNRLFFEHCALCDGDRLSEPGKGLNLAFGAMEYARFGLASLALGTMKAGLSKTRAFAMQREIWTGTLGENAYFTEQMGQVEMQILILQTLVETTAKILDKDGEIPQLTSLCCKILAGEWASQATDAYVQFHGGRGYTETVGIGRLWRDARILRIFEGPSETLAFQLGTMILRQPELIESFVRQVELNERSIAFVGKIASILSDCQMQYSKTVPNEALCVHVGHYSAEAMALSLFASSTSHTISDIHLAEGLFEVAGQKLQLALLRASLLKTRMVPKTLTISPAKTLAAHGLFDSWAGQGGKTLAALNLPPSFISTSNISELPEVPSKLAGVIEASHEIPKQALNLEEMREALQSWLKKHTRVTKIDNAVSIASYGVDSLLAYELLCFIEEEFHTKISETTLSKRPSINELTLMIMALPNPADVEKPANNNISDN